MSTADSLNERPARLSRTEMAFAECTGLEATMEPKVIKEGGRNYGAAQRAGRHHVRHRGVEARRQHRSQHVADFQLSRFGAIRAAAAGTDHAARRKLAAIMGWQLAHAMPVKYKFADLNAKGTEVGIEELHFVHEGLSAV